MTTSGGLEHRVMWYHDEWVVCSYQYGELTALAFFDTTYALSTYLDFWRVMDPNEGGHMPDRRKFQAKVQETLLGRPVPVEDQIEAIMKAADKYLLDIGSGWEGEGALSGTTDADGNRLPSPLDDLPSDEEMRRRKQAGITSGLGLPPDERWKQTSSDPVRRSQP